MPAHPDDLDLLLLDGASGRRVQRDGVRFNGSRYLSPVLAAYVGEQVTGRCRRAAADPQPADLCQRLTSQGLHPAS